MVNVLQSVKDYLGIGGVFRSLGQDLTEREYRDVDMGSDGAVE